MSSMQEQPKQDRIRGVFSSQEVRKVGTGTTTRKTVQKTFWFVEQDADGAIQLQALNNNYIPSGPKKIIGMDELINGYSPEPEFYVQSVFPKMQALDQTIVKGDGHRDKGETFSAEHEYAQALKVDEENIRANFGIGLTYLARGEVDKADNIFNRLVNLDATFDVEHKHLFNDFGINLRKNKMYKQSVDYYNRALTLSQEDDNLHINAARALLEEQEYVEAVNHLLAALKINPGNETALKFLGWMDRRKLIPPDLATSVSEIMQAAANGTLVATPPAAAPGAAPNADPAPAAAPPAAPGAAGA
jgi:tetratricopeptide (TPR) repeat protein